LTTAAPFPRRGGAGRLEATRRPGARPDVLRRTSAPYRPSPKTCRAVGTKIRQLHRAGPEHNHTTLAVEATTEAGGRSASTRSIRRGRRGRISTRGGRSARFRLYLRRPLPGAASNVVRSVYPRWEMGRRSQHLPGGEFGDGVAKEGGSAAPDAIARIEAPGDAGRSCGDRRAGPRPVAPSEGLAMTGRRAIQGIPPSMGRLINSLGLWRSAAGQRAGRHRDGSRPRVLVIEHGDGFAPFLWKRSRKVPHPSSRSPNDRYAEGGVEQKGGRHG